MLTPAYIPVIVFTVLPILLVIVILFTRPGIRRLVGAFIGGCAFDEFSTYSRHTYCAVCLAPLVAGFDIAHGTRARAHHHRGSTCSPAEILHAID